MDFDPPRQLTVAARQVWDRQVARIYNEGRMQQIDHDLLAAFAETTDLYWRCKAEVVTHRVLVQGCTARELVRDAALTPLA